MSPRRALVIGMLAAGALELAAGIYLLAGPGALRIGLFFCVSGLCTGAFAFVMRALTAPPRRGEGGDGGRGGAPPEPPWWPDFERGFRSYLEREGGDRPRSPARPAA